MLAKRKNESKADYKLIIETDLEKLFRRDKMLKSPRVLRRNYQATYRLTWKYDL